MILSPVGDMLLPRGCARIKLATSRTLNLSALEIVYNPCTGIHFERNFAALVWGNKNRVAVPSWQFPIYVFQTFHFSVVSTLAIYICG